MSDLPQRFGPRPRTQRVLPHQQLEGCSPDPILDALTTRIIRLPNVRERESRMASAATRALWIPDPYAQGPSEAFIDDHEFCHVHTTGYIHMSLPPAVREIVVRLGWGEVHPSAEAGFVPATWVMIYAPRDEEELHVVSRFIRLSYDFASGTTDRMRTGTL